MGDAMGDYGMYDTRDLADIEDDSDSGSATIRKVLIMGDAADDAREYAAIEADYDANMYRKPRGPRPTHLPTARERAERELAAAQERLAALDAVADRFGEEPPVGTVITFRKRFPDSNREYSYAALRTKSERVVGGGWFLTGRDGSRPRTWEWLTEFIGDSRFRVIEPPGWSWADDDGKPLPPVKSFFVAQDEAAAFLGATAAAIRLRENATVAPLPGEPEKTPAPGESGYDAAKFEAATRRKYHNPLAPFTLVIKAGQWTVLDRRESDANRQIVATFPADADGVRRADQSVRDRNRAVREDILALRVEPPVGARVRSMDNRHLWAQRMPGGWMRFHGKTMQAVRLSWPTVCRQLSQGGWSSDRIEPGTPDSTEMFDV